MWPGAGPTGADWGPNYDDLIDQVRNLNGLGPGPRPGLALITLGPFLVLTLIGLDNVMALVMLEIGPRLTMVLPDWPWQGGRSWPCL